MSEATEERLDFQARWEKLRAEARREAGVDSLGSIPPRHIRDSFETYGTKTPAAESYASAARAWATEPKGFLVLSGEKGTGKTHLATAVFRDVMENTGGRGLWVSAVGMANMVHEDRAHGRWGYTERHLAKVNLLLFDDYGKFQNKSMGETAQHVLMERWQSEKPTIVTLQVTPEEMANVDSALASRFFSAESVHIAMTSSGGDLRRFPKESA